MNKILLVGSRKTSIDSLRAMIEQKGYRCRSASNQRAALQIVRQHTPDLIILDHTSARLSAHKIVPRFRRLADVPVVAIVRSKEQASKAEAAAHLVRPFTSQQLLSCIRRTLHRFPLELSVGELCLNLRTRCVQAPHLTGQPQLTPKLFALLRYLMKHNGRIVSRAALMKHVWQTDFVDDTRTLDVHVRWVRQIIEPHPSRPIYLLTVRGKGYRIGPGDGNP